MKGIVLALESSISAPQDLHVEFILLGCNINIKRDVKTSPCKVGTNMSGKLRMEMKKLLLDSSIEYLDDWVAVIREIDPLWINWAQFQVTKCMIARAYSKMDVSTKAQCFCSTNRVESQNRVVKNICYMRMVPGITAKELKELYFVRMSELGGSKSLKYRWSRICRNFGVSIKKTATASKRKSSTILSSFRAEKRQKIDRKAANKKALKNFFRMFGEALMEAASENGRQKVLAGLFLDIETTISSRFPSLDDIRLIFLRLRVENVDEEVPGARLSTIHVSIFPQGFVTVNENGMNDAASVLKID